LIYFLGLLGMKLCVLFIFSVCPWISWIGDWALRWTEGDPRIQVFFVMLLFPLIMNAMQYYIIDSFIKDPTGSNNLERLPIVDAGIDDHNTRRPREDSLTESEDTFLSDDDEEIEPKDPKEPGVRIHGPDGADEALIQKSRTSTPNVISRGLPEYNPATDGDYTPTIVGSSSNSTRTSPVIAEGKCGIGARATDEL
jgi:STIMATE family